MNQKNKTFVLKLTYAAMCLALCILLPFLTGQIPQIGNMLSPMHIPVLLAGYLCGPWWAALVGILAPLLRNAIFGMPPYPGFIPMCFELAVYGLTAGILYLLLPKKIIHIYTSLLGAMLAGRIVWGIASAIMMHFMGANFTWHMFAAGAFFEAIPGIILHIILIPILVIALKKSNIIKQ